MTVGSSRPDVISWSDTRIVWTVPNITQGTWPVTVTTAIGTSPPVSFKVTYPTWYLAEGSSAWGFDTSINIENPNDSDLTARMTFDLSDGSAKAMVVPLPGMSQTTVNPHDYMGAQDFSTRVECLQGMTIAVDRTMRWPTGHGNFMGEHSSIGVTRPATTWYLPEGSSAWGFECWLLVQNPNAGKARCRITYMLQGASPVTVTKTVSPNSRATFNVADDIGPADASIKVESDVPVIPERAMYTHWVSPETGTAVRREGYVSIGATTPAKEYYLAEGSTAWGFTTYVLVQNPNKVAARVALSYMTGKGAIEDRPFTIPPESRKTVRLNDLHPNIDLSTLVRSDKPIIAERSMYWTVPGVPDLGQATHDSIGIEVSHTTFYLPDGAATGGDGGVETYTLVQNPNASAVKVRVSYLTHTGKGNVVSTDTVKANSRKTYDMGDRLRGVRAATIVECITHGKKIVVERSMYFGGRWGGTDTIGSYTD